MFANRTMFVSTDSPDVIREAKRKTGWNLIFSAENRTNAPLHVMLRERGVGLATLESFLNLELALEAEGWVCTLLSGWCTLIDTLRGTVAGKASLPFLNLHTRRFIRDSHFHPYVAQTK